MLFEGLFYEITFIFGVLHTGLLRTVYGRYPPPLYCILNGVGWGLIEYNVKVSWINSSIQLNIETD